VLVGGSATCRAKRTQGVSAGGDLEAWMKRVALVMMVLAAAVAAADQSAVQSAGSAFRVENPRIDLGEIKAGTEAVATFVFHNDGPEDVKIIKAKPS
jgi:hypothetical protein